MGLAPSQSAGESQATAGSGQVWLNGQLLATNQAAISVFDHGLLYGDGVFEGLRSYGGRILKLATHLKRLNESARAIRLELPYTTEELADAIRATVAANDCHDGYIRLCVTRGVGSLGLDPFKCTTPTVFIIADRIQLFDERCYREGLAVITASTLRNHPQALPPRIKSMNYLNNILAKIEALDAGVFEAIMLNHQGYVAEGTGDNVFIVRQVHGKSVLQSPPLHAGTLEGVTMRLVEQLAHKLGIHCEHVDLTRHDLYTAEEMFLTGTAAELIPVTMVDKRPVGDGKPGPVTQRLMGAYRELVGGNVPED